MGYSITLQDIIDAVRYDARVHVGLAVAAAVIGILMYTTGSSALSNTDPRLEGWEGKSMSKCAIQAQALDQKDRALFIQTCQARAS